MTSLTLVRRIRARPETVFAAMTEPGGIAHWWTPDAGPVLIAENRYPRRRRLSRAFPDARRERA